MSPYFSEPLHMMLTKAECYCVLKRHRIFCLLGLLPVEVDLATWRLKKPSLTKRLLCFLSYIFHLIHTLYISGSWAHAYFCVPDVKIHQLVIHGVLTLGAIIAVFCYNKFYISDFPLLASYFNITLLGNVGDRLEEEDRLEKPWMERLKEYSLQDLLALTLPCMILLTILPILAAFVYDPSMRLLLYASLPSHLQTWTVFGLCAIEELRFMVTMTVMVTPMWQFQVISYDLISNRLQLVIRKMQNGTYGPGSIYRSLRGLQVYVCMVDSLLSRLVFITKLVLITICIVAGYAAIAHFADFPIFGIMFYVLLVDGITVYTVLYEKAFKIPQLFDQASADAMLYMGARRRDVFGKQMLSVRPTGIKIGNFHTMERASTLIFMNEFRDHQYSEHAGRIPVRDKHPLWTVFSFDVVYGMKHYLHISNM